ncbi:MAG TPA: 23S rRNA (pseudouridine(1915)-N(3))-methyltransferase RlmH [Rhodospirillales bacterium]|jgi:23S rRNA (pseudouridine1915-N3)-methyltransferase|nr:23S rRNA (pseudouridine(1915)-N(3))-methyltransferase RlmH [Rhodospirillales bacterium]
MTLRVHVLAVGRTRRGRRRDGPESALFASYAQRITPPPVLREIAHESALGAGEARVREGKSLLGAVPESARVVALDEGGRTLSSEALARQLERWQDQGARDVAFVIGGPAGLDAAVTLRADLVLSLGPMTWPHLLVRGLIAEQIYRAQSILSGHPYHRA